MICQWISTYKELAEQLDATISDMPNDVTHVYNCLLALLNLTSFNEGSEECYGAEATLAIMPSMKIFYTYVVRNFSYIERRWLIVIAINNFTTEYFGNLTDFVNEVPWDDGCVPYYWAQLSEEAGFDTNGWNVCS
jgi:hypothetical protein